jgi:hypothetical protein
MAAGCSFIFLQILCYFVTEEYEPTFQERKMRTIQDFALYHLLGYKKMLHFQIMRSTIQRLLNIVRHQKANKVVIHYQLTDH